MDPYGFILESAKLPFEKLDIIYDSTTAFFETSLRHLALATPQVEATGLLLGGALYILFHIGILVAELLLYGAIGVAYALVTVILLALLAAPFCLVLIVVVKIWYLTSGGMEATLHEEAGLDEETELYEETVLNETRLDEETLLVADSSSRTDSIGGGSSDGRASPEFIVFACYGSVI